MKKQFEGYIHNDIPVNWDQMTKDNPFMNSRLLKILKTASTNEFRMVTHNDYCCCEYETKMNIMTFSKYKLNLKMNVIGLPGSVCAPGYTGDLHKLILDYKKRKGLFLVLNIEKKPDYKDAATGETLGNCIFENKFTSFEEYLSSMKSGYRRRINIALKKSIELYWKRIASHEYTDDLHRLYTNVFERSKYPLEYLKADFFRLFPGEIFCLCEKEQPLAFVLLHEENGSLSFVFGGMDYDKRDKYDLYMNMLIFIIKECIRRKCFLANLGQTAENSKLHVGACVSPRYLCIFSGNYFINSVLKSLVGTFSYKNARISRSIWKTKKS
jgi:hypothetical protein